MSMDWCTNILIDDGDCVQVEPCFIISKIYKYRINCDHVMTARQYLSVTIILCVLINELSNDATITKISTHNYLVYPDKVSKENQLITLAAWAHL